jgi:hypothetical protein
MRPARLFAAASLAAIVTACASAAPPRPASAPEAPSRLAAAPCFPVEALPSVERQRAEEVLLAMADGEGLYTLAGGLKPVSSGVSISVQIAPELDVTKLAEMDMVRRALAAIRCGEIGAFLHVFTDASPGERRTIRSAEVVLFHRASVVKAIERHAEYFGKLGITPSADPREVLAAVENASRGERWRGYGLLFGYPDEAVDFFVAAGLDGDTANAVVPRDFKRIETWKKYPDKKDGPPTISAFVYAVPKGAAETPSDRALREAAAPIYARYADQRPRFVRPGSSEGAAALWRAWLMPGNPR